MNTLLLTILFFFNTLKKLTVHMSSFTPKHHSLRIITFFIVFLSLPVIITFSQFRQYIQQYAQAPSSYPIYGKEAHSADTLNPDWTVFTGKAPGLVDLNSRTTFCTGTSALSFTITSGVNQETMTLQSGTANALPIDISPYTYLTFFARATEMEQRYGITLIGADGNPTGKQIPMYAYGGVPPTDKWQVYNIPLADMTTAINQITGIEFADLNRAARPPVYFDDMAFSTAKRDATQCANPTTTGAIDGQSGFPRIAATPPPEYFPKISPWVYIVPGLIIFLAVIFQ